MKKNYLLLLILLFISSNLKAEDYSLLKIMDIKQGSNDDELHLRSEEQVSPYDDETGNFLVISEDGTIYIHDYDYRKVCKIDNDTKTITKVFHTDKLNYPFEKLQSVSKDGNMFFADSNGRFEMFSKDGTQLFKVIFFDYDMRINSYEKFYDKKSDVIFATNNNKSYCIVHPSMNQQQNKSNYKNSEETLSMLKNGEFGKHLSINENNNLIIDGKVAPFGTCWYGNYRYQVVDEYFTFAWNGGSSEVEIEFEKKENEKSESTAIHPCGDIYRLVYNSTTNLHTLYRVENTWDPQWRQQWYAEHSSKSAVSNKPVKEEKKSSSVEKPSYNVAKGKKMQASDNLRLRKEEATSSEVITTMLKGTKVKILKLGKEETLDGIKSCWVQVEVQEGGKDRNGNAIQKGTTGWCYGGYLE